MRFVLAALAWSLIASAVAAADEPSRSTMIIPGAGIVTLQTSNVHDEKFVNIVRQTTDYSCGAAAVATILRYAYNQPATEADTIRGLLFVSDPATVKDRGFSLLDIKHYVQSLGFVGTGYHLPVESLYAVKVPTIVLLTVDNFQHFVVLKKATPDYVYLADPMLGNRRVDTQTFAKAWNGIMFVVASSGYDRNNSLLSLEGPMPLDTISSSLPSATLALNNAELMSIYIPAMNRF